jgi:hypothetical protein
LNKTGQLFHEHIKMDAMSIPKKHLIVEHLWRARMIAKLVITYFSIAVAFLFAAWLAEYSLTAVNLLSWLSNRWYISLGITAWIAISAWLLVTHRSRDWDHFVALSSDLEIRQRHLYGNKFITGGIRFDNRVFGPFTVSVGPDGIRIWQNGEQAANFPWSRFQRVKIKPVQVDGECAHLTLDWDLARRPPKFVIPWESSMSQSLPAHLLNPM